VFSQSISASSAHPTPLDALTQKRVHRWFGAALDRLPIIVAAMGLLLVLYVGSYFAMAFATGAGWMEVATRHRIVWTVYWPLSTCAVNEPPRGPRYINDANGWFFRIGRQCLHE
jgi:hypothetical protein